MKISYFLTEKFVVSLWMWLTDWCSWCNEVTLQNLSFFKRERPRAAVVLLNFRAGSTFPVPVCTESPGHSLGLAGATRLTRSDFRLNLLLLKGQGACDGNAFQIITQTTVKRVPLQIGHFILEIGINLNHVDRCDSKIIWFYKINLWYLRFWLFLFLQCCFFKPNRCIQTFKRNLLLNPETAIIEFYFKENEEWTWCRQF